MRISDWSSDVCSSDLLHTNACHRTTGLPMRPRRLDKVFSYPESPDLHKYRVAHMMRRVNLPCLSEGKGAIVKHPAQKRHTLRYSPKDPDKLHPSLKKRAASAAPSITDRFPQPVFLRHGDFQDRKRTRLNTSP